MATFAKIVLDTRKNSKKDDGTFPIILRLWHQGSNRTVCSLGYYATKDDWDASTQNFLKTYKQVTNLTRINNYLIKKRILAFDVINELKDSNEIEEASINEINQMIRKRIGGGSLQRNTERLKKKSL